jgi:hypothetical protein
MNKLKILFITSLLFITTGTIVPSAYAQYDGSFDGIYFLRSISAQSTALGMTRSTMPDKAFTIHNNSSLLGFQEGFSASYSTSNQYFIADDTDIQFIGLSGFISDKFALGISHLRFNYNSIDQSISTLALIFKPSNLISLGVNARRLSIAFISDSFSFSNPEGQQLYLDLTSSANIPFELSGALNSSLKVGLTLNNISRQSLVFGLGNDNFELITEIPSVAVLGIQGHIMMPGIESSIIADKFSLDAIVELQEVFNYDYFSRLSFGFQLGLNELVNLRVGHNQYNTNDYGFPDSNKSTINQFTYGAGLNIPISSLFRIQKNINLTIDYVKLEHPQVSRRPVFDIGNYETLNISLATKF